MADEKTPEQQLEEMKAQLAEAAKGIDALKAKNDELLSEKKAAQKKALEEAEAAKVAIEEAARKAGDVQALEKSWADKLAKRESELLAERDALGNVVRDLTVTATATKLAAELAVPGSADVLLPHITKRLALETQDGKPVVRVLGADGKPSAASVEDLAKEISGNAAFAPLIVASKATGGGASGGKGGGAASTKKVSEWTDGEKSRFIREQGLDAWKEKLKAAG